LQVNLLHGDQETSSNVDDYVLPEVLEQMVVHLYDVGAAHVEGDVPLDHLTTEQMSTKLFINISDGEEGYHFTLDGFQEENVHLVIKESDIQETVIKRVGIWLLLESRTVSIMLVVSVFIVTLGMATMIIAMVKRHRLAIESVIYGSIGSIRRLRKKAPTPAAAQEDKKDNDANNNNNSNSNLTTATEVAFFPRYSVVNKSWREGNKEKKERKSVEIMKDSSKETSAKKDETRGEALKYVDVKVHSQKSGRGVKKMSPSKQSLYEIISTLRFKSEQVNKMVEQEQKEEKEKKDQKHQTSFYYLGNPSEVSSKYDLTLAKTLAKKIEVQVHQPDYESSSRNPESPDKSESSSPQPLIPDKEDTEGFYSFNTLREKCRKMIANSKSFPAKTKL